MGCGKSTVIAWTSDEARELKGKLIQIDGGIYMKVAWEKDKLSKIVEQQFHNIV